MRCVVSAAKPAACSALLLGAVIVAGFGTGAAHANEPDAVSSRSWCVARSNVPPDCVHPNPVSCSFAALFTGGYCFKDEQASSPAPTVAAAPPRQKRNVARRKAQASQNAPASQQDELFKEFEQWKRTTAQ